MTVTLMICSGYWGLIHKSGREADMIILMIYPGHQGLVCTAELEIGSGHLVKKNLGSVYQINWYGSLIMGKVFFYC